MSSYLFLATLIAMVWLVYWAFGHDVPGFRGGTGGLFGMKDDPDGTKAKSFIPKWKRKLQARSKPARKRS
jgi:hypothetical protein